MNAHTRHLVRKLTMAVMLGFFVLGSLFAGGYAMEDPGGAAGRRSSGTSGRARINSSSIRVRASKLALATSRSSSVRT